MKAGKHKRIRKVQYSHYNKSYEQHPVIRLAGNYLDRMDFKIGDAIEVQIEKGYILITKVTSQESVTNA